MKQPGNWRVLGFLEHHSYLEHLPEVIAAQPPLGRLSEKRAYLEQLVEYILRLELHSPLPDDTFGYLATVEPSLVLADPTVPAHVERGTEVVEVHLLRRAVWLHGPTVENPAKLRLRYAAMDQSWQALLSHIHS